MNQPAELQQDLGVRAIYVSLHQRRNGPDAAASIGGFYLVKTPDGSVRIVHGKDDVALQSDIDTRVTECDHPTCVQLARELQSDVADPILDALGAALLPSLGAATSARRPGASSLLRVIALCLADRPSAAKQRRCSERLALAPWQIRRAKEFLFARISERFSLAELAAVCKLSRSHFARAFKSSIGVSPGQWVIERRIEMAKTLLAQGEPLAEIATRCGFADQSHLTRTFAKLHGVPPGLYRRMLSPEARSNLATRTSRTQMARPQAC